MIKKMVKITIYSTPVCPYCKMVKDFLDNKKVEYVDIDVSINNVAADEMVKKSGQMGVPVIVIEKDGKEEIIVGFKQEEIEKYLA